jgi:protein O-mannosyl-transferase
VHPMMTEAVGYISARSEVLCATFFLLALLSARRWMLGGGARWWCLSAGLWLAALLSKEIAVMFPFVLLAYDRWILPGSPDEKRRSWRKLHVPFASVTIGAALARGAVFLFLEHPGEVTIQWSRVVEQLSVVLWYVAVMVLPRGQAVFHEVTPVKSLFDPPVLLAIVVSLLVIGLAGRLRRSHGVASLGALWFLLLLVPSSALS